MGDIWSDNPWAVQMENFLHFCCPECDAKDKNKDARWRGSTIIDLEEFALLNFIPRALNDSIL